MRHHGFATSSRTALRCEDTMVTVVVVAHHARLETRPTCVAQPTPTAPWEASLASSGAGDGLPTLKTKRSRRRVPPIGSSSEERVGHVEASTG